MFRNGTIKDILWKYKKVTKTDKTRFHYILGKCLLGQYPKWDN